MTKSVTPNSKKHWETMFTDRDDWYVCDLNNSEQDALENLQNIILAENWMHDNCSPESAYRFGGRFYFKNKDDHTQFSLIWM